MNRSAIDELDRALTSFKAALIDALPEILKMLAMVMLGMVLMLAALLLDGIVTFGELLGGEVVA